MPSTKQGYSDGRTAPDVGLAVDLAIRSSFNRLEQVNSKKGAHAAWAPRRPSCFKRFLDLRKLLCTWLSGLCLATCFRSRRVLLVFPSVA